MPAVDDETKRVREARLLVSPPDVVFEELRNYGTQPKPSIFWADEAMERSLVQRNDPLINLGLARFGSSEKIVGEIYAAARQASPPHSERYWKGLRVACLSNQAIDHWDFPRGVIGDWEIRHVIAEADEDEAAALICNPGINDGLLESLYERTKIFSEISDERWLTLIYYSASNPRLGIEENTEDSPDLGHHRIHQAIVRFLEISPVTPHSMLTAYQLLDHLDPGQTSHPEKIDHILDRWSAVADNDQKGKPHEGHFTSLSFKNEFRALVAALYGKSYSNKQTTVLGSMDSSDVALRCAYYGNATLTAKEMQKGFECDNDAFVFAVLLNDHVYFKRELRNLLEEKFLAGSGLVTRYRQRCNQIHSRWKNFDPRPSADWLIDESETTDGHAKSIQSLESRISDLGKQMQSLTKWLGIGLLVLFVIAFIRR